MPGGSLGGLIALPSSGLAHDSNKRLHDESNVKVVKREEDKQKKKKQKKKKKTRGFFREVLVERGVEFYDLHLLSQDYPCSPKKSISCFFA